MKRSNRHRATICLKPTPSGRKTLARLFDPGENATVNVETIVTDRHGRVTVRTGSVTYRLGTKG